MAARLKLVGHDQKPWIAFLLIRGFVLVGMLVFRESRKAYEEGVPYSPFYSNDMLVPIIVPQEKQQEIDLKSSQRYNFHLHKTLEHGLIAAALPELMEIFPLQ